MSTLAYPQIVQTDRSSLMPVLGFSVALHVVLLVVAPVTMRLFMQSKKFERPQTFQIVTLPRAARAAPTERSKVAPTPKPTQAKPAPRADAKPVPKEEPQPQEEENLDELANLLDNVAPAVQVGSVSGNFKYHWYLKAVTDKVQRYWNPPTETGNDSVVVAFTIFSDGNASDPKVVRSSGTSMLDNLAMRALTLASPFGKLPPGFSEDRLDLTWTLRTLRQ